MMMTGGFFPMRSKTVRLDKSSALPAVFLFLFWIALAASRAGEPLSLCDIQVDRAGKTLYILEAGPRRLAVTDAEGNAPILRAGLPMTPVKMRFVPGEEFLAVVGGLPEGKVALVRVKDAHGADLPPAVEKVFDAGHSPSDVAPLFRDGKLLLYVTDRFAGLVREIDGGTGEVLRTFGAGREPVAVRATPDGAYLAVGSLLPEDPADVAQTSSRVRIIDLASGEVTPVSLENGISNLYDLELSPDGRLAIVTATRGNYRTVTTQVEGGWIVDNVIVVVDIARKKYIETFALDNQYRGAPNPWGIRLGSGGAFLAVGIAGSGEVELISVPRLYELINYRLPEDVQRAAASDEHLVPFKTRFAFGLEGTRSVAMHGGTVWTASYFDDAVGRARISIDPRRLDGSDADRGYPRKPKVVNDDDLPPAPDSPLHWVELNRLEPAGGVSVERALARLAPEPDETAVRRGERLFCNALICREHWQSCITCHPDARADALSWDLLNDGTNNPKNTKSLLFSHETPPSMITGVREDAETAVRAGVIHILFSRLPEEDYCAIDEYLKSLRPLPSPHLEHGKLSESARRGRLLFESSRTGCADCHSGEYFTDLMMHRTASQDPFEPRHEFDTPTLREIWRTAPYLSTGHWTTLRGTLKEGGHGNQDGRLDRLTDEEFSDLIEYVLSL